MAARVAARYVVRRLSSGGKVLSEEEKAVENVYIKVLSPSDLSGLIFFIFIHFNLYLFLRMKALRISYQYSMYQGFTYRSIPVYRHFVGTGMVPVPVY
ncbi:hypothetical protein B296_00034515 [Ensete ventricosum]|uniref:Uncharacterized protein n=1 Tax=Ensete ventricosum TaxID=4639 RepID=A0A427A8G3_ENSVE|nr:hypothetical protein B296_00034515 [Ensete ventricosum]